MLGSVDFGDAVVVADLEAGIGTLTRLDEQTLDVLLVVVEPTAKSIEVGRRASAVAAEGPVGRVVLVANRIGDSDDLERVTGALTGPPVISVPDDPAICAAEREGLAPLDSAPDAPAVQALVGMATELCKQPERRR